MALVLTSGPASEPVTLEEAKAHLRLDTTVEDALVMSLILTSRLHVEAALGLALITQSWQLRLDAWPGDGIVEVPLRPLQSVAAIRVRDRSGVASTVAGGDYQVDAAGSLARIAPAGVGWPEPGMRRAGIEIDFTAGFGSGASSVPATIRQAILMLVAHWYEHRDPVEIGSAGTRIPAAVSDLLMPYRMIRI